MPIIKKADTGLYLLLCLVFLLTSCNVNHETPTKIELTTQTPELQKTSATSTPTATVPPVDTSGIPTAKPSCYKETLPTDAQNSSAVEGWNQFAKENNISTRFVYFPSGCSRVNAEQDVENLFFRSVAQNNEIILMLLEPSTEGTLGKLYAHLQLYGFWAMGPEDYPVVLDKRSKIRTNIIIIRTDKMNGEGTEGNALLSMMKGMAEHEYIHTIQAKNNPDLSEMFWTDNTYRAFMERYANLHTNAGQWYAKASQTDMGLLQFLDGLNSQNNLEPKVTQELSKKGMDLNFFLGRNITIYNNHIIAQIQSVGDKAYLDKLNKGEISPMLLFSLAGSGDIEAYDVIKSIYDNNIKEYNSWYYGSKEDQYLPNSFNELFSSQ